MNLLSLGLMSTIPAVGKATASAAESLGQGFRALFDTEPSAVEHGKSAALDSNPTMAEHFQQLADNFRQWLAARGVQSPFELDVTATQSEAGEQVEIRGSQAAKIQELLQSDPERIGEFKRLAKSALAAAQTMGHQVAKLTITDIDTNVSSSI